MPPPFSISNVTFRDNHFSIPPDWLHPDRHTFSQAMYKPLIPRPGMEKLKEKTAQIDTSKVKDHLHCLYLKTATFAAFFVIHLSTLPIEIASRLAFSGNQNIGRSSSVLNVFSNKELLLRSIQIVTFRYSCTFGRCKRWFNKSGRKLLKLCNKHAPLPIRISQRLRSSRASRRRTSRRYFFSVRMTILHDRSPHLFAWHAYVLNRCGPKWLLVICA